MRNHAIIIVGVFVVGILACVASDRSFTQYAVSAPLSAPAIYVSSCNDDQPCWNWRAMGNHRRAIVLTNGRRLLVNGLSFDGYRREHRIDWTRTPHLRGDR